MGSRAGGQAETSVAAEGGGVTRPTEAQLVEMEQRARAMARDVLSLVRFIRQRMDTSDAGRLGGLARGKKLKPEEIAAIGKKGGDARAAKLSPARRRKIAKKANAARWLKSKKIA
jgi:general stress protein YciG